MLETIKHKFSDTLKGPILQDNPNANVNMPERVLSILAGTVMTYKGIKQILTHPIIGIQEAMVGGVLLYRGATGICPIYSRLGKDSTDTLAISITERFIVNKPRKEVYAFWRNLENLPRFMKHLASVEETDQTRSKWKANLPGEIAKLSWNAEITREEQDYYIGWNSVEGSMVDNAGKVEFTDALNGSGTELNVEISYFPPAGSLGQGVAKLLNGVFEKMIREDITNFKHYVEGEEYNTYLESNSLVEKVQNTFK
ncbi:SRPBCC family protein [Daejeonella oryzae]|uniref:SRPBCC family protein n=1 Tax=Daejeonella oryzae TaxID=1122943 RepID=UPI000686F70D|nr:SRPBCC family protein [Daejeonella oryzae]